MEVGCGKCKGLGEAGESKAGSLRSQASSGGSGDVFPES